MKFQGSHLNPCLILKGKQKAICTSSNRLILSTVCCVVCVCVCKHKFWSTCAPLRNRNYILGNFVTDYGGLA